MANTRGLTRDEIRTIDAEVGPLMVGCLDCTCSPEDAAKGHAPACGRLQSSDALYDRLFEEARERLERNKEELAIQRAKCYAEDAQLRAAEAPDFSDDPRGA